MSGASDNMLPALVIEKLPRLVRAIKLLAEEATPDESIALADELSGITAMVAEKFTNDRTAEGIQRALLLTVGGVSLGLEHLLDSDDDLDALDILIEEGPELVFQSGFRLVRDLSMMPEHSVVADIDAEPVYMQSRMKQLFFDLCMADPGESWSGYERYLGQLKERQGVQAIVRAAQWLRRHHDDGPINDPELDAEGAIALAVIFAIEGGGRITARTGQKGFERLVKSVRKNKPDFEAGWAALMERVPAAHQAVIAERIDTYRKHCKVLQHIGSKASMKQLFDELKDYAGNELEVDYP